MKSKRLSFSKTLKLVNKWEATGLLDGLSAIKKTIIVEYLENNAIKAFKDKDDKSLLTLHRILFPAIRQCFDKYNEVELDYDKAKDVFKEVKESTWNTKHHSEKEAELVQVFVKKYIKLHNN